MQKRIDCTNYIIIWSTPILTTDNCMGANETGWKIKTLRSDHGTEYFNREKVANKHIKLISLKTDNDTLVVNVKRKVVLRINREILIIF